MWVRSLGQKIPWRRAWRLTLVFLLENPMDRGAWWVIVHRVAKSQTRLKWLSTHTHMHSQRSPRSELVDEGQ